MKIFFAVEFNGQNCSMKIVNDDGKDFSVFGTRNTDCMPYFGMELPEDATEHLIKFLKKDYEK